MSYAFVLLVTALCWSAMPSMAEPLFPNSIVSNDLEFIRSDDPGPLFCLAYEGQSRVEMPDVRHDELVADDVHVFTVAFADATSVGVWVHPDLGDRKNTENVVEQIAEALTKVPRLFRHRLDHIVIHDGDEAAFAEDLGRFFVLYSDNIEARISTHDLEETLFHESVHATLDQPFAQSAGWKAAQSADAAFVTTYAAENPDREDMAESLLFAWAMMKHPARLPPEIENAVRRLIPNRLAYFEHLLSQETTMLEMADVSPC